jgi:hypothetical protein
MVSQDMTSMRVNHVQMGSNGNIQVPAKILL